MSGNAQLGTAEMNVEELQDRLTNREELVTELTDRLEQAAEQLDRLKRSGADRGGRVLGGIPPELIDQQRTLTADLQNAVQQWDEMQPTDLLVRVEMQVTELRDLIVDRLSNVSPAIPHLNDLTAIEPAASGAKPIESSRDANPETSELSSYEAFKAGLLDSSQDAPPPSAQATSIDPAGSTESETPVVDEQSTTEKPEEISAVDPPATIDLETADVETLRDAVDQRNSYIAYLVRKLRVAESATRPAGNWHDLESVPDELRSRLEELETSLQESLRKAEVETSLERARLGREAARLESVSNQLRKQAVQLGLDDSEDGENRNENRNEETDTKNSRWFRMFGK